MHNNYLCIIDIFAVSVAPFIQNGLWGAPPTWSRTLVTHTCPSGYCNCTGDKQVQESEGCPLYYENFDRICDKTRNGTY